MPITAALMNSVKYSHSLRMHEEKELKGKREDDERDSLEIEQVAKPSKVG